MQHLCGIFDCTMMEGFSNHPLNEEELALEQDLGTGEYGMVLQRHDALLNTHAAIQQCLDEIMNGEGRSFTEKVDELNNLSNDLSQAFSNLLANITDRDELIALTADIAHTIATDLANQSELYGQDEVEVASADQNTSVLYQALEDTDPDNDREYLTALFSGLHRQCLQYIVDDAKPNENDLRQQKREHLTSTVRHAAYDIGRTALGAAAAIVIVRFFDKKHNR